ncbi:tRNA dimethylallyltransferase 2 isoform X2 [Tripterygium wilfordii]|uniref:tRNA dimethylallyltransferase 2 isoform X2 n=1 Tax=Tripterygium wilfordii TaxID=458696 RepID=UPI0018F7F51A|nr:tRNA dimethylallyltransferase 2 isoform X2 [Tripterygium wilfordii]
MDTVGVLLNPNNGGSEKEATKPKVVAIMGPTGSGKSRLAIDLASHFPIEIINADSMQVYRGLDVLTNKVPLHEQKGVPHHLLGSVSPNVEFTAKNFRDFAIPCINDIWSRNCLPVIVGGTNYYIQALVSPFLLDDSVEDPPGEEETYHLSDFGEESLTYSYSDLKILDPVAANRIHPNDCRKINQYLNLYARSGILPSRFYQEKTAENWGQADNSRFDCCFICVDAAAPVLDLYVEKRVDCMIDTGLLDEVYDIYNPNADYTRGLQQAIGVREFENFLGVYLSQNWNDEASDSTDGSLFLLSMDKDDKVFKEKITEILSLSDDNKLKVQLEEAIKKVKVNTRRLVRRQKRRITRLQELFGWNIHYVEATESISSKSDEVWASQVVRPAVKIIGSFLNEDARMACEFEGSSSAEIKSIQKDLWTQYTCEACGDRVLRGAHEWEQHTQGRRHRKQISRLRKSGGHGFSSQHL